MPETPRQHNDAVTTPVGVTTICPQCGVMLDALTTTCGACGAVITGAGTDTGRGDKVRAKLQDAIGEAFVLGDLARPRRDGHRVSRARSRRSIATSR